MSATIKPNKEHLKSLIDFLYKEVISSGGDGDALWYSKFFSLEDIMDCFKEYAQENNINWTFNETIDSHFNWGQEQEWITVTTSKDFFEKQPDWYQIKLVF